jgi:hypothetical protein
MTGVAGEVDLDDQAGTGARARALGDCEEGAGDGARVGARVGAEAVAGQVGGDGGRARCVELELVSGRDEDTLQDGTSGDRADLEDVGVGREEGGAGIGGAQGLLGAQGLDEVSRGGSWRRWVGH